MQFTEGYIYLSELNGYCKAPTGWGGCARVSCSHNCGIFLCNDVSAPKFGPFPAFLAITGSILTNLYEFRPTLKYLSGAETLLAIMSILSRSAAANGMIGWSVHRDKYSAMAPRLGTQF